MSHSISQFFKALDDRIDQVRKITRPFCEALQLTGFAYVRVYPDGRIGWLTSDADHDRFLYESGFLEDDPLIDTAAALQKGHYLWFHNRSFPGDTAFYQERERHFHLDHGLVVVNHKKEYLETGCFSGLLSKRPLYNTFSQEINLFKIYLAHFSQNLSKNLSAIFEEGMHLKDLKSSYGRSKRPVLARESLIAACGWAKLLSLSPREQDCLALLREGKTYQRIAEHLELSPRTVESYLKSIKNKLNLQSHEELWRIAETLFQLGL